MNKILTTAILAAVVLNCGCASYMSYESSRRDVMMRKAYAGGDDVAIKAVRNGDMIGVGVDVSLWEVFKEHPFRQVGAMLLDGGLLWASMAAADALENLTISTDSADESLTFSTSGDGNTFNVTNGDGNTSCSDDNNTVNGNSNFDEDK